MKVCLARITGAHGIRGLVKVRSYTHQAMDLLTYKPLTDKNDKTYILHLERMLPAGILLCRIDGCLTRNDAEAYKGLELFVDRSLMPALESDTYYYSDLEGLAIIDPQGNPLGRVKAVNDHGAGVFLDVVLVDGKTETTLPFFKECVVNLDKKHLLIDPLWLIDTSTNRDDSDGPDHLL